MDANSPAEGKLDCGSCDGAVVNFVIPVEGVDIVKDVYPLTAYVQSHSFNDDDDDDDEEEESEDEEWQPHVRWICINCTMPNPVDEDYCWKCKEHRDSNILKQRFASVPSELTVVDGTAESAAAEEFSFPETVSKNLMFSGTFVSGDEKKTAIGFDERMLLHEETGKSHPERPNRLRAIMEGFQASGLLSERCFTIPSREATQAELEIVHSANHISAVQATEGQDLSYFTSDTYANEHSALAARLAAGICADLASAIMIGTACNGFAVVRPPGHHAEQEQVMGFCLHNNVCVAARAAQASGAKKVLIVDWDVHHGNGTQEIFEQDPTILYISLHRHEAGAFYPGTGWAHQVGSGPGEGFCVNIPWGCGGIGDEDYLSAFQHLVMPIARQFEPDITIISAGFDAACGDPLGGCDVTPEGYAQMTSLVSSLTPGRILVVLEGGYNLRSISASAAAVMKVLQGSNPPSLPDNLQPTPAGLAAILDVFTIQRRYWSNLHDATFLKLETLLSTWSRTGAGKGTKRRYIDNPVWWKWDRKRLCADVP